MRYSSPHIYYYFLLCNHSALFDWSNNPCCSICMKCMSILYIVLLNTYIWIPHRFYIKDKSNIFVCWTFFLSSMVAVWIYYIFCRHLIADIKSLSCVPFFLPLLSFYGGTESAEAGISFWYMFASLMSSVAIVGQITRTSVIYGCCPQKQITACFRFLLPSEAVIAIFLCLCCAHRQRLIFFLSFRDHVMLDFCSQYHLSVVLLAVVSMCLLYVFIFLRGR